MKIPESEEEYLLQRVASLRDMCEQLRHDLEVIGKLRKDNERLRGLLKRAADDMALGLVYVDLLREIAEEISDED